MKNFVCFVKAVLRNFVTLLNGGIIAASLMVYEHVRRSSIKTSLFWLIVVGLFMWALYKAWLEERQRVSALESELSNTRKHLEVERARKPAVEAQTRLLDAQREEIEVRKTARRAQEEHEARMKFLTAPDTGIRPLAADEAKRNNSPGVITVEKLVSALSVPQSEIEEALRILKSQGLAKETRFPEHWLIQP